MSRLRPGRAAALVLLCGVVCFAGAAVEIPPAPDRWATDTAGFLSPATVRALDESLERYERQTGHQVLVYIGKTTEGEPIEDFAVKAFAAWKVGRKGLDDGLVLFIMAEDRKVRIEVGYGLEAVVPDIIAGRIINDILVPKIRSGDPDGGVREAVGAILERISGKGEVPGTDRPAARPRGTGGLGQGILIAIAVVFFLILFVTHPRLALWLLFNILSSGGGGGRGGRGGFGGGGFRGGGGRSGGGGASGGW